MVNDTCPICGRGTLLREAREGRTFGYMGERYPVPASMSLVECSYCHDMPMTPPEIETIEAAIARAAPTSRTLYDHGMSHQETTFDTARRLADAHRKEDPDTERVLLSPSPTEIRLVEVSPSVASATPPAVMPFRFVAQPEQGVHFPSVVILLSPDEWALVENGSLQLPDGWDMGSLVVM